MVDLERIADEGKRLLAKATTTENNQLYLKRALNIFNKGIHHSPMNVAFLNNRGMIFLLLENNEDALLDFDAALEFKPDLTAALMNRATAYHKKGYNDYALADLHFARQHCTDDSLLTMISLMRGNIFATMDSILDSVIEYSDAIRLSPDYSIAHQRRGEAFVKLRQYSRAIEDLTVVLTADPEDTDASYFRGIAYLEAGMNNEAVQDLENARYDEDHFIDLFVHLGKAYLGIGNHEKAESYYSDYVAFMLATPLGRRDKGDYEGAVMAEVGLQRINPGYAHHFTKEAIRRKLLDENEVMALQNSALPKGL